MNNLDEECKESLREFKHNINNHLAVMASFLSCCEGVELNDEHRQLFINSVNSFKKICRLVERYDGG